MHHVLRIIREMLIYEPTKQGTNIKDALSYLGKIQKRAGICFLISDFICENYSHEFKLIAKKQDLIAVEIADAYEQGFPNLHILTVMDLETGKKSAFDTRNPAIQRVLREMQDERSKKLLSLIKRIKGGLISLRTDQEFVPLVRRFFKMRKRQIK